MNSVLGKVVLVTGGGSGIGAASAELLAEAGANVVVSDINIDQAQLVADAIADEGGSAIAVAHDVTSESGWDDAIELTIDNFGHLDVLVNNAGISGAGMGTWEDQTLADWHRILQVNLDGVFMGCQRAIRVMKTRGGSIINISSILGIVGGGGTAYSASKGGVRLMTKSIVAYCGNQGYPIRANSVHPGYVWTPLVAGIVDHMPPEENMTEDGLRAMLTERHPIGRLGVPEDIARGVLFLASDDSSFMTGAELVIDGGYTAV